MKQTDSFVRFIPFFRSGTQSHSRRNAVFRTRTSRLRPLQTTLYRDNRRNHQNRIISYRRTHYEKFYHSELKTCPMSHDELIPVDNGKGIIDSPIPQKEVDNAFFWCVISYEKIHSWRCRISCFAYPFL